MSDPADTFVDDQVKAVRLQALQLSEFYGILRDGRVPRRLRADLTAGFQSFLCGAIGVPPEPDEWAEVG